MANLSDLGPQRPKDSHWLIPGTIRGGTRTLIFAHHGAGKTLLAAEMAVSATTQTGFCGGPSPWLGMPTAIVTEDTWQFEIFVERLLTGRDFMRKPDHLFHTTFEGLYGFAHVHKNGLLIVDAWRHEHALEVVHEISNKGWTVVVIDHPADGQGYREWAHFILGLKRNIAANMLHLYEMNGKTLMRARDFQSATAITFARLPTCNMSDTELAIWQLLRHHGRHSTAEIIEALKLPGRVQDVRDVLIEMGHKGAIELLDNELWTAIREDEDVR